MANNNDKTYCGFVSIIGRPNVGKSTLLNRILGKKMSITSRKPQTTRHRFLGIKTQDEVQTIYVDTPGMHIHEKRALNRYMNKEARASLRDVDVIVFVITAMKWNDEDGLVLELLKHVNTPVILAVNKVDNLAGKEELLPFLEELKAKRDFSEIIPVSAKAGSNVEELEQAIKVLLPESPHYFPEDQETDKSLYFRMAEIIREKIVRAFGDELPHTCAVEIESYQASLPVPFISAIIWLEREGQKPILIGKNGERLKKIGMRSRSDIEKIIGKQVHLKLWVKIKKGWSDNKRILKSLGYVDFSGDGED